MSAPAILRLRSSWADKRMPEGGIPTKLGRQAKGILVWATPNPINRVRTTGNGRKILPNKAWAPPKVEVAAPLKPARKWIFA